MSDDEFKNIGKKTSQKKTTAFEKKISLEKPNFFGKKPTLLT